MLYSLLLGTIYVFYVTFESISGIARFSGYKSGHISVGVAIQSQILSLNRFVGFLIPPMIGYYIDIGGSGKSVFYIGLFGSLIGGLGLILVYVSWKRFVYYLSNIAVGFVASGYGLKSLIKAFSKEGFFSSDELSFRFKPYYNFIFAQMFTTGLAMPSVFLLNIWALGIPEYSTTILQMTTAISGVGNLVLNFYTIPLLAVHEAKSDPCFVESIQRSIFFGKVVGMLILSPFMFFVSNFLFF